MPRSEAVRVGRVSWRAQSPDAEGRSWTQGQGFPNLLQKPEISIFVSSRLLNVGSRPNQSTTAAGV